MYKADLLIVGADIAKNKSLLTINAGCNHPNKIKKKQKMIEEIMDLIIRAITSSSSVSRVVMEQCKFSHLPVCFLPTKLVI